MKWTGNLRKMKTSLGDEAQYRLPLFNMLKQADEVDMNALVGKDLHIRFEGEIHCVVTGKKINKSFGEGMSFEAWRKAPQAVESIMRPELSRIHEGVALRDFDWEEEHHNKPHFVYLSLTSDIKVGVTRQTNVPSRWIDQGATQAIVLAETPYRQLAGLIEVELKDYFPDKTNWRHMLTNTVAENGGLLEAKEAALENLSEAYYEFISENDTITEIHFPVLEYPQKVTSLKLDTLTEISGNLRGIRGQYLIFSGGRVLNVRSHAGYKVCIET